VQTFHDAGMWVWMGDEANGIQAETTIIGGSCLHQANAVPIELRRPPHAGNALRWGDMLDPHSNTLRPIKPAA
jgi:hypothetical protein